MSSAEDLQIAIQAAREGRRVEARDLLIQLVEENPENEVAWMWLAGLVDSLEDRIIACENVLTINPANEKVRAYLNKLRRQQQALSENELRSEAVRLLNQAKLHGQQNDRPAAVQLARAALEKDEHYEDAWLLIGKLSSDINQQMEAFEKAYQINPSNQDTAVALEQLRYLKANPLSLAKQLEQAGQREEALKVYHDLAAKAQNTREFDHIYKQILRIERLQDEKIRYVAPSTSIIRLTFAWPLLYLSLALVQMGLNPIAHPSFYSCMGLPLVLLGSFLLSLAEVRSNHSIWQKLFGEQGDGSSLARFVTATAGWLFILIPHVFLFMDSLTRLQKFEIPPMPF